jgi:hypothetical protein
MDIIAFLFICTYFIEGLLEDLDFSKVGTRIIDEIVKPLNEVKIDDPEFACLKAVVFFDPSKNK